MATSRIWVASRGIALSGARRLRQAGDGADVGEADAAARLVAGGLLVGGPLHRRPRPGRTVRRPTTTSSGPRLAPVGGQPVPRRAQHAPAAACRTASCPSPACGPGRGRRAAGRAEPLTPAAAVVPPSVPGSLPVTTPPSVSAKLPLPGRFRSPGRPRRRRESRWGRSLPRWPRPARRRPARSIGVSSPSLGSCSTITSSASPQVLPVERLEVGPADRPGRVLVDHRRGSATPPRRRPAAHAAIANGDLRRSADQRRRLARSAASSRPEKWNHAATSRASDGQAEQDGGEAERATPGTGSTTARRSSRRTTSR